MTARFETSPDKDTIHEHLAADSDVSSPLHRLSANPNTITHTDQEETERYERIKADQSEISLVQCDATFAGYSPWKFPPDIVSLVSANTSWT